MRGIHWFIIFLISGAIAASGLYQITLAVVEYKQEVFDCEELLATLKNIDII